MLHVRRIRRIRRIRRHTAAYGGNFEAATTPPAALLADQLSLATVQPNRASLSCSRVLRSHAVRAPAVRRYWEQTYHMRSELGRGDNLLGFKGLGGEGARGTSVFCPVLTEMMYRWFCPAGGSILDPFAGGCVRGCVAARLGLRYVGLDLSAEQIVENRRQAALMRDIAERAGARWAAAAAHRLVRRYSPPPHAPTQPNTPPPPPPQIRPNSAGGGRLAGSQPTRAIWRSWRKCQHESTSSSRARRALQPPVQLIG